MGGKRESGLSTPMIYKVSFLIYDFFDPTCQLFEEKFFVCLFSCFSDATLAYLLLNA